MTVPSFILGMGSSADMSSEYQGGTNLFNFYVKKGGTSSIIFLTDGNEAPVILEHQYLIKKAGKNNWNNYITCCAFPGSEENCPMCMFAEEYGKFDRKKVQLFTVLNLTPWKDKKDVEHKYGKQILRAKRGTSEILARKYADRLDEKSTLKGALFQVFRTNDPKSAGVGTDFTFKKMVDLSKFPPEDLIPVDIGVFAPDRDKLRMVAIRLRAVGGGLDVDSWDKTESSVTGEGAPIDEVDVTVDY